MDHAIIGRSEFDRATAVRPGPEPGRFLVEIDAGWTVGPKPNGGYLLALAARAAGGAAHAAGADHADPLAATAHYVAAPDPGPAEVHTAILRTGRSASQVRATITQDGRACVDAVFTLGTLGDDIDAWWEADAPAEVAPIESCVAMGPNPTGADFTVAIRDRSELWLDPADLGFMSGRPSGHADLRGWTSFRDGRPADPLALLYFVDSLPPGDLRPGGHRMGSHPHPDRLRPRPAGNRSPTHTPVGAGGGRRPLRRGLRRLGLPRSPGGPGHPTRRHPDPRGRIGRRRLTLPPTAFQAVAGTPLLRQVEPRCPRVVSAVVTPWARR